MILSTAVFVFSVRFTVYWESFTEENFRESPSLTQLARKHSRDHQFFVRPIPSYIRVTILFLQIPSSEGSNFHRMTVIDQCSGKFTHGASLPPWLPLHIALHVQTIFFHFSATTNINNGKMVWPLAAQDYPSLVNSYYVSSCSLSLWTNLRKILCRETNVSFHFLLVLSGIQLVWWTHIFIHFASFSVILHLVWQPDLINMDGSYHFGLRTMRPVWIR